MFNFTPLLGAQSASPASQSLLEFDGGIKVLVDAGWDETFDPEKLKEIEKHVPTLSFILLTHATTAHLGAFAHCCKHFPLFTRIPVYATTPVINLGRTLLQDIYASTPLASSVIPQDALNESAYSFPSYKNGSNPNILLQPPTADEIATYFGLITQLKYSQPHQPLPSPFSPPLGGLTITAYSAGHTLGGTIWHIQHNMESVVYAVDWNQAREHVLSGAAWLGVPGTGGSEVLEQLRRPTALICSSKGAGMVTIGGQRHKRDDALLSMIRETVANGGSVLIPSDSSARILELAYLLEETWQKDTSRPAGDHPLTTAKLFLASRTGGATMRYVRSMLEWMEEGIVKEFETATGNAETQNLRQSRGQRGGHDKADDEKIAKAPFDFRHITLLERRSQVNRILGASEPRVILASDTSVQWGFSKDAIKALASDSRNLIILTQRATDGSQKEKGLGRYLWELWNERNTTSGQDTASASVVDGAGSEASVQSVQRIALEGNELQLYQQYLARQRALQNTIQGDTAAAMETSADVVDDRSSSTSTTSEDSDIEHQGKALNTATTLQHARHKLGLTDAELGINILIRRHNVFDYQVQGKKGREKSFPYVAKRRRADDMGEVIRPEDYMRADERDEADADGNLLNSGGNKENAVGMKRKWDDLAMRPADGVRGRIPNDAGKQKRQDPRGGPNAPGAGAGAADDMETSESEAEDETDKIEGPSKVILGTETLKLNCRISFVDYSGLHDRRAIQMLVPLIKPRKLIFVAGEAAETVDLADECRKLLNSGSQDSTTIDVFAPTVGTMIDASVDTNAWTVKLSREFARKLQWQTVRGLGVVAITGLLRPPVDLGIPIRENSSKKAKLADSAAAADGTDSKAPDTHPQDKDNKDAPPILDILPPSMASATRSVAQPFYVGDLRLADLRRLFQAQNMTAEFRGEGVLVIDGTVAIRKSGTGRIEIDGGAYGFVDPRKGDANSGTFFKVRRIVYGGLAVVGGA